MPKSYSLKILSSKSMEVKSGKRNVKNLPLRMVSLRNTNRDKKKRQIFLELKKIKL